MIRNQEKCQKGDLKNGYTKNNENNIKNNCNLYNPLVDSRKLLLFLKLQKILQHLYE